MIDNDYKAREERSNIRQLGDFGKPNLESIYGPAAHPAGATWDGTPHNAGDEVPAKEKEPLRFNPVLFSLILLGIGALVIAAGITIVFGIGWGLTTLGVLIFGVGFMTALEPKDAPTHAVTTN